MKESIQSSILQNAIDCGFVQAAYRRVEEMGTGVTNPVQPPTIPELEEALGQRIQACELLAKNWRNHVYKIRLANGATALAKQVVMGNDRMLQCQYDQLAALASLQIPGLRVPKALALLRAKRVCVMEFATGTTIQALVWDRLRDDDMVFACELAGKILARMQIARTDQICSMPLDAFATDLNSAPWRLSSREQTILQSALESLTRAKVRIGQVYYDYKPANLLFENEQLSLVDPPDVFRRGVLLWDFSCFRSSMRRHLWRFNLRRPFNRRRTKIREAIAAFERSYLAGFEQLYPEPALFAAAARLFDLQRTAVLMTMQQGKVMTARRKASIAREGSIGNSLVNRSTLPLLEIEKRWLFSQLAHELSDK